MTEVRLTHGARHHTADGVSSSYLNFADEGRGDRFYRFSVKCDRAANIKISKLAKAEGLSPGALVQRHFESLISGENTQKPVPKIEANTSVTPAQSQPEFTLDDKKSNIVMTYLHEIADSDGCFTMNIADAAANVFFWSDKTLKGILSYLISSGRLIRLVKGSGHRKSSYKIPGGKNV